MPEGACIFVDFDQVNEMAGVSAHGFGFRPAQIQLAEFGSLLPKMLLAAPKAWSPGDE